MYLENISDRYARNGATALAKTHQERAKEALDRSVLLRNLIRDLRTISQLSTKEKSKGEAK